MQILEPKIELWKQGDDVKAHVAKCARVCYGKEIGNDDVTINTLLKKHHWSMFRHESVYVIGEFTSRLSIALTRYDNNPYIDWTFHNDKLYIVTNGNLCRPYWISPAEAELFNNNNSFELDEAVDLYINECNNSFNTYKFLIEYYNFSRQDARGVLPLDTATKCIYTYSINEWKHIIKLISDSAAHPNAQIISNMIKKELESLGYEFN